MLDRGKLGRGLDSLLGNIVEAEASSGTLQIDPGSVQPNPHQPRRDFAPEAIKSLMESIREHGWSSIPAIVKETTPKQSLGIALVENLQREDLNPIEKARDFWELIEVFGLTQEAVGRYTGLDRSSVANTLRLLELPIEVQEHVSRGTISQGHAR